MKQRVQVVAVGAAAAFGVAVLSAASCGGDSSGTGGATAATSDAASSSERASSTFSGTVTSTTGGHTGGASTTSSSGSTGGEGPGATGSSGVGGGATGVQTVFVILMENHNWSDIKGHAPYIDGTLLVQGAHAEQYFNPPGNHPSEPNYIWLEAGDNLGITNDSNPSSNHLTTTAHLSTQLDAAGISWKAYQEDIDGSDCPVNNVNDYAPKHDPFVFFDDVTGGPPNFADPRCQAHIRPFGELATDLASGDVARYNFLTPNLCNDMHDCSVSTGDDWLAANVPTILNSAAYQAGGALFITWDEGEGGDGPIGMIVMSPLAKAGYASSVHTDHSSYLKTVQEIFGVTPLLGAAANPATNDLADLFTTFP